MLTFDTIATVYAAIVLAALFVPWSTLLDSLAEAIIRHAQKHPYEHLAGYMERYWLLKPRRWLPIAIRVQHILRSDSERHLHSHPGACASLLLRGAYVELTPWCQHQHPRDDADNFRTALYTPGDIVLRGKTFRHRLLLGTDCSCWTLFITWRWPEEGAWGFHVPDAPGAYVDRREYAAYLKAKANNEERRAA